MTDSPALPDSAATPVAETTLGPVRGTREDGLDVFRGVPYAAPPVGEARWRAARPHAGWSDVRDATAYGPSSPQPHRVDPVLGGHGAPPFDEDCLTLNVWTPAAGDGRRPVLVWLHGGGFVSGSGTLPIYAGDTFARNGDLVVVSVSYRVGALGFLYLGAEDGTDSGNFWITDQLAALAWVRDNIAAFGGDPGNVTVAGQSGGAFATLAIACRPEGRGLFHRMILQSPPLGLTLPDPEEALRTTRLFTTLAGVEDAAGLRAMPWEEIVKTTVAMFGATARPGQWLLPFWPVLDGVTLDRDPLAAAAAGAARDVDGLLGWTRDEATFAFALDPQVDAATTAGVTDGFFRTPGLALAEARAKDDVPLRLYQFDWATPATEGRFGATHCLDLPFTFHNAERWSHAPFLTGADPGEVEALSDAMHRAWIAFARTGDPDHPGIPHWEPYRADTRTVMRFGTAVAPTAPFSVDEPATDGGGLPH